MKRSFTVLFILPFVASLAIIGTGFSLWVFDNDLTSSTADAVISVEPTLLMNGLTLTLPDDEITLDQGHEDFGLSFKLNIDVGEGDSVLSGAEMDSQTASSVSNGSFDPLRKYTVTYSYTYKLILEGSAKTYLESKYSKDSEVITHKGYYTYDKAEDQFNWTDEEDVFVLEDAVAWNTDEDTIALVHEGLGGQTNAKPVTVEEYDKMTTALTDQSNQPKILVSINNFTAISIDSEPYVQ